MKNESDLPNLDKVDDPFSADPQMSGEAPPDAGNSGNPDTPPNPGSNATQMTQEIASLKAQLAAAQNVQVVVQQPQPQAAPTPMLTTEQLQAQAESLGFTDPKQVESIGRIAAHVAAPAYQKAALLEQELKVERTVNSAKKMAQANDAQFSKLEPFVDEFLDGVSVEDKMNPERLKTHMERAQFYAKGKMGIATQSRRPAPNSPAPKEDELSTEGNVMKGPETWTTHDGKIRLTVQPRVSDAVRKMHTHPSVEGGVQIDPREEWKGAVFQKDIPK